MVLPHLDSRTERRSTRIGNFSAANENHVENFMNEDNTAENDPPGTISSEQEMTVDIAPRGRPSLVALTVRRDGGKLETFSCESMPIERQRRFLQALADTMSAGGQRTRCNGRGTRQARKHFRESFQFDAGAGVANGDQIRRSTESSDSSNGDRTRSDMENRDDPPTQSSRRKRARKISPQSTRITRGPQQKSSKTFLVEDCSDRLQVGDDKACSEFYRRVLTDAQQGLCKKLAKWWIKAINPNKQTNNPYAGGPEKRPNWWPMTPPNNAVGQPTKGTLENGFVRHKEPDHLSKSERLILLPHILIQIVDPCNSAQFNSINATKLQQISLDSISNESTDKDKHESWRRFVIEIFRVAKMQERYKRGEIDDTTITPVRPSYDIWRHKGSSDETEEDSISDGEYDDEEDVRGIFITPESVSEQDGQFQDQMQPQPLRDDIKQDYASYVHNARLLSHRQNGTNDQTLYRRVDNVPNQMLNQPPYSTQTPPIPRSYQQPNLMLQEPFRRHSDTSDRFSNPGSFLSNFLPSTNMAHITNFQYQTIQPVFQLPTTSNCPTGPVLPPPFSAPITRSPADNSHFPTFHDTGLLTRTNATFQASVRDTSLGSHGNLTQLPQQQQNFQEYLQNQDYGHNAPKMHVLNLNNATRPDFTYDQENTSNASRSEFGYEVKPQCSLEPGTFDLEETPDGGSNGHSEHAR